MKILKYTINDFQINILNKWVLRHTHLFHIQITTIVIILITLQTHYYQKEIMVNTRQMIRLISLSFSNACIYKSYMPD